MNAKTWTFLALLLVVTGFVQYRYDPHGLPVHYAVFGALGCLLMLFVTKVVAKRLLSRKEDYYERN